MRPKKPVDEPQSWFWTKRWQEGEREAEDDIGAGRVHSVDNVEDAIALLRRGSGRYTGKLDKA